LPNFFLLSTNGLPLTDFLTLVTFPFSSIISSYSTLTFLPVLGSISTTSFVATLTFLPVLGSIIVLNCSTFLTTLPLASISYSAASPSSLTSTITSLNASSALISFPLLSTYFFLPVIGSTTSCTPSFIFFTTTCFFTLVPSASDFLLCSIIFFLSLRCFKLLS